MAQFEDFDIVIRQPSSKVIAAIPERGLLAEGETADSAIQKLKEEYAQYAGSGQASFSSPFEAPYVNQHRPSNGLGIFAAKTAIVTGILTVAFIVFTSVMADRIESTISKFQAKYVGGTQFWSKIERELARAADPASDLPEVKRQKLLSEIRTIANRWRPFVAEASALFENEKRP